MEGSGVPGANWLETHDNKIGPLKTLIPGAREAPSSHKGSEKRDEPTREALSSKQTGMRINPFPKVSCSPAVGDGCAVTKRVTWAEDAAEFGSDPN